MHNDQASGELTSLFVLEELVNLVPNLQIRKLGQTHLDPSIDENTRDTQSLEYSVPVLLRIFPDNEASVVIVGNSNGTAVGILCGYFLGSDEVEQIPSV